MKQKTVEVKIDVGRALREIEEHKNFSEEEKEGKKRIGECPHFHCGGFVIEVTTQEFEPSRGPQIIGPGGRSQWRFIKSYHCDRCKTVFIEPPPS